MTTRSGKEVADVRPLAELAPGAEATVVELRLGAGRLASSALRPGAVVHVTEANRTGWLHVRINFREYSVPPQLARQVLVALPAGPAGDDGPRAGEVYAVLCSRVERDSWRVRVVRRDGGAVVRSEGFDGQPAARRRFEELRGDAERLAAAAFRERHGLP
jgi:hypothetical protein